MKWESTARNSYTSYVFLDGKSIVFEVLEDGHYLGTVTNADDNIASPKIYMAGFCNSAPEAMDYINKSLNMKDTCHTEETEFEHTPVKCSSDCWNVVTNRNDDGTIIVSMSYDNPDAVIKYTTNGHTVMVTSKIYRDPFVVESGTTLKATAFVGKEHLDEYSKIIE